MSAAAAISSQRHSVGGRILLLALLTLGACRKPEDGRHGERKGPLVVAEQPPLPEDPERGQRSTAQWSQHLQHEEDERQGIFDRQRIPQHRALMKLLTNARKALAGDVHLDPDDFPDEMDTASAEVGLSFIGRPWSEAVLVRLAFAFEQATRHRRPPRFLRTADLART